MKSTTRWLIGGMTVLFLSTWFLYPYEVESEEQGGKENSGDFN